MADINFYNVDCMDFMKDKPDNYYDLAIVDVNYGIKQDGRNNHTRGKLAKSKNYNSNRKYDDKSPDVDYFNLLRIKAKNQIIFGANHFIEKFPFNRNSSCWIIWDKLNGLTDFADCEIAWTSFKSSIRKFSFRWQGMLQGDMKNKQPYQHPNQKPIQLYRWILKHYGKPGYKIFDSHGGSASIAIACDMEGFDLDICEIDKDYFDAGKKRFDNYKKQLTIF